MDAPRAATVFLPISAMVLGMCVAAFAVTFPAFQILAWASTPLLMALAMWEYSAHQRRARICESIASDFIERLDDDSLARHIEQLHSEFTTCSDSSSGY